MQLSLPDRWPANYKFVVFVVPGSTPRLLLHITNSSAFFRLGFIINWVNLRSFVTLGILESLKTNQHDKLCTASEKTMFFLSGQNLTVVITLHWRFNFHVSLKSSLWSGLTRPWNLAGSSCNSCQDSKKKVLLYQNERITWLFSLLVKPIVLCRTLSEEPAQT